MIDATILVPTFRHATLLPHALESALTQEGVKVEVLVVGDGVEDDTRRVLEPYLSDNRIRFFDFPKGERHGERFRHEALRDAIGAIVCYLSDDDLLLPGHVAEMSGLLDNADFAHSAAFGVRPDGSLWHIPIDISRADYRARLLTGRWNAIGLTGTAHTLDAYRRLPHGWRPAPPEIPTDLYMWQQFVRLPGFRGRSGTRLTHLHFASSERGEIPANERVAELERWSSRVADPVFGAALNREALDELQRSAVVQYARIHELEEVVEGRAEPEDLQQVVERIQATRWWRLRTRVATFGPLQALRARLRATR